MASDIYQFLQKTGEGLELNQKLLVRVVVSNRLQESPSLIQFPW